jgi:Transposase zinc-binding domain/Putative transposase
VLLLSDRPRARPSLEVADVFRRYGGEYRQAPGDSLSPAQRRVLQAIEVCRPAALGGPGEECDEGGHQRSSYHSCAERHCPKCPSLARAQWLEERPAELLETQYFPVVFTLPEEIAGLAYQNKKEGYGILFRPAAETLGAIAADPRPLGAAIGFFAVLHRWGQTLLFPPHLHGVIAGGGISPEGSHWVSCRPGFCLPVRVLSRLFRRLFLEALEVAFDARKLQFFSSLEALRETSAFRSYLASVREREWVV